VKIKEYQNMTYVESRSVNFPATVTNIRSQVDNGLVDDLIKEHERREISRLEFVSKVLYTYKKELYVISVGANCSKTNS
jgi:hypothetical protein